MRRSTASTVALVLALILPFPGCALFDRDREASSSSPTAPSPAGVTLQSFAGTWTSATVTPPLSPSGCGNLTYTVTPTGNASATVTYAATCAGNIQVNGSGAGTLKGQTLEWSAQGLVTQGGVNCPLAFNNSRATQEGDGIKVTYAGTVCGIPVSGTEVVTRK